MCLIFSFERKELKGSRNYHLVKPLSPSKLVHPYDGSVIPSIHSPVGEHFIVTARSRLLPLRTGGFLVSHPASWIEVQSLPRGCSFLTPTRQGRNCTFHQQISYQRLLRKMLYDPLISAWMTCPSLARYQLRAMRLPEKTGFSGRLAEYVGIGSRSRKLALLV